MKTMTNYNPIVGLFGTCGKSTWRKNFISTFSELGISFFNPQVENWSTECAETEAQHLVDDDIILFPITNETTGYGSLAETGFSILQTIKFVQGDSKPRLLIIFIDSACEVENPADKKASINARALVRAHLRKFKHTTVLEVGSLDEMLTKAVQGVDLLKTWNTWKNT